MGRVFQVQGTACAKAQRQGEQWAFEDVHMGHGGWAGAGKAARVLRVRPAGLCAVFRQCSYGWFSTGG